MVAPKNILESYRDLPPETREAMRSYWQNLMKQHAGTPWEDFCSAWASMFEGDAEGAERALLRVIDSDDPKAVAQARSALALLHEEDEERASAEYARAASDTSAVFAMYKQAEKFRRENRHSEAEALLKRALDHLDDADIAGVQFIAGEYVLVLLTLGRRDDAVTLLTQLIEKYPNDFALRRRLKELR